MTCQEAYALSAQLAREGVLLGPVAYVKAVIVSLMDATERFTSITCKYTGGEKQGQTYRDGWKLHNSKALVSEDDRRRAANPTRDDLLPVWSQNRRGWRSLRVDSIQSIRVHPEPGVAVDIPVMAYRP